MTPIFSLRLVEANADKSVFGWKRIDVLQIMPSALSRRSVMSTDPGHPRTFDIDYACLYIGDGHLNMASFDDDLMEEVDVGIYELIEEIPT